MNRLTRDQILIRALDMVDAPNLDVHDRPAGTIVAGAYSIPWLQDALDLFHNEFPGQGQLTSADISLTTAGSYNLPADFILDMRNGLVIPSKNRRLIRTPAQKYVNQVVSGRSAACPERYTVMGNLLKVWPIPDQTYSGTLFYHALPSALSGATVPNFPSDLVLIDYVRIRGLEQLRLLPPGSARTYATVEINRLRAAGLQGEPEDDEIPFDQEKFRPGGADRNDWMGATTV